MRQKILVIMLFLGGMLQGQTFEINDKEALDQYFDTVDVVLHDDFEDGDFTNNPAWEDISEEPPLVSVVEASGNHRMKVSRQVHVGVVYTPLELGFSDFHISFNRIGNSSGDPYDRGGVHFYNSDNRRCFMFRPEVYRNYISMAAITNNSDGTSDEYSIARSEYNVTDAYHEYDLYKVGNLYVIYEDGIEKCRGEYQTEDQAFYITGIGLYGHGSGWGAGTQYDDITIKSTPSSSNTSSIELSFDILDDFGIYDSDYYQNQAVIEVEIVSESDVTEIEVVGEFDGAPMKINIPENRDMNGDSIIDSLDKNVSVSVTFYSKVFNENQDLKDVRIAVKSISGKAVNKTIEDKVSVYYTQNNNEQNRAFNSDPDYYQFTNDDESISLKKLKLDILTVDSQPILLVYKEQRSWKGLCYGFSASAGAYFKYPILKPLPEYPWNWGLEPEEIVLSNINLFQLSQLQYFPSFRRDPGNLYDEIKKDISNGDPVIVGMRKSSDPRNKKHAVLATKITEYQNSGIGVIHIYNTWEANWLSELYFHREENKFKKYDGVTYDEFGIFPQLAFVSVSKKLIISKFYNNIASQYDSLLQKVFASACPVNMHVVSNMGQRVGFLEDGQMVNEIPNAEIERVATGNFEGDSVTYIFVPADETYQVNMVATDTGSVRFEYYEPVSEDEFMAAVADSVSISQGTKLTYSDEIPSEIGIDNDGDGDVDIIEDVQLFSNLTGIPENVQIPRSLTIQPNPMTRSAKLVFGNPGNGSYRLSVYDLSGKLVRRQDHLRGKEFEFYRNNLPGGLYLIELVGEELYRGKILIR